MFQFLVSTAFGTAASMLELNQLYYIVSKRRFDLFFISDRTKKVFSQK